MAKITLGGADSLDSDAATFYQTTVTPAGDKVLHDVATSSATYATIVDEASATVTYVGKAKLGTAQASALWQIFKITESGSTITTITWADGNSNFDNVWNDRASLTYS